MKVAEILLEMRVYNSLILNKGQKYVMAGSIISQLQKIYPGGVIERDDFSEIYNKLNIENVENTNWRKHSLSYTKRRRCTF
jgi:hypothetical protein